MSQWCQIAGCGIVLLMGSVELLELVTSSLTRKGGGTRILRVF